MQRSNMEVARHFIKIMGDKTTTVSQKVTHMENEISWQQNDAFKTLKNINETSLNKDDRTQRIYDLESKFGIPKTHIL